MNAHISNRHIWLLFWIAVPLFVGLLLGWAQAGSAKQLARGPAVLFVISGVLPSWWLYGLVGGGIRRLLPRASARLPRPVLLLLAPCLASFLLRPIYLGRKALFSIPHSEAAFPGLDQPIAMMGSLIAGNLLGIIIFPLLAMAFQAMFDLDVLRWIGNISAARSQPSAGVAAQAGEAEPIGVLARIPAQLGRDIHAFVAAEHYLRVITAKGETMVLYRLGDAIRDMETAGVAGIQVHRSYWIATRAIARHSRDGGRLSLTTPGGLSVPVSRSYRQALKARTGL